MKVVVNAFGDGPCYLLLVGCRCEEASFFGVVDKCRFDDYCWHCRLADHAEISMFYTSAACGKGVAETAEDGGGKAFGVHSSGAVGAIVV